MIPNVATRKGLFDEKYTYLHYCLSIYNGTLFTLYTLAVINQ